ncbi:Endolytic murein transglycosylase [Arthrobacter sp. Bi26]|uniref:endolytic transglycosylase MltG n=1 Tax=Arthrobacter sp. Bi26 TaxID=2822350 RepID=UPI001D3EA28F|nr:endolytic transglycosylase MltG [Arthrobacter sp. Bi26]CAH0240881.1 Endolytic murein transglycosylase [Arthrobacter sp. Bi26]
MSPVNSDDSSGDAPIGADRALTRKEIRAREKFLATQGHNVIPPQAFETGQDVPTPAPARAPEGELPQAAPELPEAAPTVHEDAAAEEPVHEVPVHEEPVHEEPVHEEPVHEEPVHNEAVHEEPLHEETVQDVPADEEPVRDDFTRMIPIHSEPVHEDAGHGNAVYASAGQLGHDARHDAVAHGAGPHDGYAPHPHDEAHHVYDDSGEHLAQGHPDAEYHSEPGHELMAGAVRYDKVPSKKVRRRRRFLALVLTLTVFVVAIAVGAQFLKPLLGMDTVADYPGPGTGDVTITVAPGAGPRSVATELQSKKVVANADTFLKEFTASGGALNPGTFSMRQEMKNSDAVDVLLNKDQGKVMYFALSAGLRISESLQAISEGTGISVPELKALSDAPAQFGVPAKAKNLEGYLAPGEYRFPLGTSAKDILQKLVGNTLDELKAQGVTDAAKQYDVVTVASIVQAEGGQAEYGDVAGAIYNRLKPNNTETNGLIQSDATVTYGLGIRSFHIDEVQKADKSNRYNTYANQGLPVGPIGSPGKTAIDAAAKPKTNSYLYWVTINLDTKETKFSKTLAEHNGYVEQYNAWCEANPGRCV